jgi:hypothetical protein
LGLGLGSVHRLGMKDRGRRDLELLLTFCKKVLVTTSLGKNPSGVTKILPFSSKTAAASVILCARFA